MNPDQTARPDLSVNWLHYRLHLYKYILAVWLQ